MIITTSQHKVLLILTTRTLCLFTKTLFVEILNKTLSASILGPKPGTINDFWRMIFEQKCPTIVMVTTLSEMGKVIFKKKKIYFPFFKQHDVNTSKNLEI